MSSQKGAFAQLKGGRLYYETAGEGVRPPIVLIHAVFLDNRMWDEQFASFPMNGHRVIRYDCRGSGRSDRPTSKFDDADDLRDLLDRLGVRSAHQVGSSGGGGIAIDYALAHPERVASLVLVAPTVGGYEFGSPEEEKMDQSRDEDWGRWDQLMKKGDFDGAIQIHLSIMGSALGEARAKVAAIARDNYHVFKDGTMDLKLERTPPAYKRLQEVTAPTLLIWGDRDFPGQITQAERVRKMIPGSSQILITGADHLVNLSRPGAFDGAVLSFVDTSQGRRASGLP